MGRLRFKEGMLLVGSGVCWWGCQMVYEVQINPFWRTETAQTQIAGPVIALANLALYELVLLWAVGKMGVPYFLNNKYYYSDSDDNRKTIEDNCGGGFGFGFGFIMTATSLSVARVLMFLSPLFLIRPSIAADSEFQLIAFQLGLVSVELQVYILIFSLEYVDGQFCFGLLVFLLSGVVCKEMIEPGPRPNVYGIHPPVKLIVCLSCALILLLSGTYLFISSSSRRPRPPTPRRCFLQASSAVQRC